MRITAYLRRAVLALILLSPGVASAVEKPVVYVDVSMDSTYYVSMSLYSPETVQEVINQLIDSTIAIGREAYPFIELRSILEVDTPATPGLLQLTAIGNRQVNGKPDQRLLIHIDTYFADSMLSAAHDEFTLYELADDHHERESEADLLIIDVAAELRTRVLNSPDFKREICNEFLYLMPLADSVYLEESKKRVAVPIDRTALRINLGSRFLVKWDTPDAADPDSIPFTHRLVVTAAEDCDTARWCSGQVLCEFVSCRCRGDSIVLWPDSLPQLIGEATENSLQVFMNHFKLLEEKRETRVRTSR